MGRVLPASLVLLLPSIASAQGINTNVALAVAEGEGIFRSQLRYTRATDDPSGMGRELDAFVLPQTLVYGLTPRLTAFATLPILAHRRFDPGTGDVRRDEEVGDFRLLGRYTFFADDYAPLSTRRVALLGGMKFPTGSDRFGTPSFDPIFGVVGTWAANRHELDLDALYLVSTERHDFEAGDRFRYDMAYRYRLWPERFGRRLLQLNGVLELNGIWMGRTRDDGETVRASGGHVLFLSPGVQLVTNRVILEASIQVPTVQDLNGPQLETDFIGVLSVRIPFALGLR
jgi:hypothetical protein